MTPIDDAVRNWARGMYPTEAGAELLIRHGRAIYEGAPWLDRSDDGEFAAIDVESLLDMSGAWSGSEQRVVRIAASLLGGLSVDLSEDMSSLGRQNALLVLAALSHATGAHEHAEVVQSRGGVAQVVRPGPLVGWPAPGE